MEAKALSCRNGTLRITRPQKTRNAYLLMQPTPDEGRPLANHPSQTVHQLASKTSWLYLTVADPSH